MPFECWETSCPKLPKLQNLLIVGDSFRFSSRSGFATQSPCVGHVGHTDSTHLIRQFHAFPLLRPSSGHPGRAELNRQLSPRQNILFWRSADIDESGTQPRFGTTRLRIAGGGDRHDLPQRRRPLPANGLHCNPAQYALVDFVRVARRAAEAIESATGLLEIPHFATFVVLVPRATTDRFWGILPSPIVVVHPANTTKQGSLYHDDRTGMF